MNSRQFLHYQLAERLGAGPLGETWQALDPALERGVVVKLLRPFPLPPDDLRNQFVIQCEQLHSTKHPPADIFDWAVEGDQQAIIRELISGRSLAQMRSDGPMTYQVALALVARIALTIKDLHHAGLVHGNVHPWNVILDERGNPWLTDMLAPTSEAAWLAAVPDKRKIYISPDVRDGALPDNRADIFSLGALMVFLVADQRELSEVTMAGAPPTQPHSKFPPEGQLLVRKMLTTDPSDQFGDIDELIATLDAIQHDMPVNAPSRRKRHSPRTYLLLSIMAVLLVIYWIVEWWVQK